MRTQNLTLNRLPNLRESVYNLMRSRFSKSRPSISNHRLSATLIWTN